MLVAKALGTFSMDFNNYHLEIYEKEKYLFAEDVFAMLPQNFRGLFKPIETKLPPFYRGEDLNGKTLLVIAQAAIGDALCMTPALREIKIRYPEMRLWVSISGRAKPVLEGLSYIDEILPMPIPYNKVRKADFIVKAVEMVGKPQFDNLNLVEYFLWKLYLPRAEDETPDVVIPKEVEEEVRPIFEEIRGIFPGKKILLFHYLASSIHRTLPPKLLKKLEDLLSEEYVPIICSLPEEDITVEVSLDIYGIKAVNLSSYMKSVKHLASAIKFSDAVITADTATLHLSAGLKKPTVLVSGPIDPDFRARTYPTVIPVRANYKGETCVSPCGQHWTVEPCTEAKHKGQFYSPCLENIPPEVIICALKDAELLSSRNYKKPENCPLCEFKGSFSLFEVINGYPIFECPSCGLQFAWPLKSADYEKIYTKKYKDLLSYADLPYESYLQVKDEEEEIVRWKFLPRINVILPLLKALPKGRHLDVGCSTGYLMLITKRLGYEPYGMEASEEAVKIACEKFGLNVVWAETFKDLPEKFREPYRLITALEVLEHVSDPYGFLKDIFDLLEEGGFLILSCPPYYKFENLALSYRKFKWWYGDYPPNHITRWKPWTLHYALKKVGFSQVYLFTEPFIPGTLLEGIRPVPFSLKIQNDKQINVPPQVSARILIESAKPLYLNAPTLGNFQYALAIKGNSSVKNLQDLISRAIRFSAVEIIWGQGD